MIAFACSHFGLKLKVAGHIAAACMVGFMSRVGRDRLAAVCDKAGVKEKFAGRLGPGRKCHAALADH